MRQADSPYWVNVTLESEGAEEMLRNALSACQMVHEWAMSEMRSKWIDSANHKVESNDMVQEMTEFITGSNIKQHAQRYSFMTTLARAVALFNRGITVEIGERGPSEDFGGLTTTPARVYFPSPRIPDNYRLLDIQSRSIWRRYMTEYDRISTHYGSMFLEEGWRKTVLNQALDLKIPPKAYPYLVYSVSIRERENSWQAHFNLHRPDTRQGKKRTKKSWA